MKKSFIQISFFIFFISYIFVSPINARLPFSHVITFFVQNLPFTTPDEDATKFTKATATPGKVAQKIAQSVAPSPHKGIFVTYGGYLAVTDFNGQVTFPRMQQKTDFTFIVTERIEPVMMIGNTVHHWILLKSVPAATYSLERKQSEQTQLSYWDVQHSKNPENDIIPLNSIVVFAKSKNIIVPSGITITNDTPQLILPPVYVVKNNNDILPALETLKVRQFFAPIVKSNKKDNNTYYSTQISNTP